MRVTSPYAIEQFYLMVIHLHAQLKHCKNNGVHGTPSNIYFEVCIEPGKLIDMDLNRESCNSFSKHKKIQLDCNR